MALALTMTRAPCAGEEASMALALTMTRASLALTRRHLGLRQVLSLSLALTVRWPEVASSASWTAGPFSISSSSTWEI